MALTWVVAIFCIVASAICLVFCIGFVWGDRRANGARSASVVVGQSGHHGQEEPPSSGGRVTDKKVVTRKVARSVRLRVAEAGDVPDEDLVRAEGVAARASARRSGDPFPGRGLD